MQALISAILDTPIIDHHAHNLLLPAEYASRHFLTITTEAADGALRHASTALPHLRAVKQLSRVLECDSNWEAVQERIAEERRKPDDAWAKRCFEGIQTVLIDDGLDKETVHNYRWHNREYITNVWEDSKYRI